MGEMREVIRGLRYEDRELEEFVKTSQLKMTSLEYAYELPKIRQVLGLKFTKYGLLTSRRISAGQRHGLIYLLERFRARTLNTRSLELKAKNSAHDPFVEQLRQVVAGEADAASDAEHDHADTGNTEESSSQPGAFRCDGPQWPRVRGPGRALPAGPAPQAAVPPPRVAASESDGPAPAGSRAPNRGDTRSRLEMDGFEYQGSSGGLRRRFEELRRLDVRDFPNAAHDLLRTVLECAIKDHFAAKGQPQTGKMLGPCIQELAQAYQNDQRMTSLINAVNRRGRMPAQQFAGTTLSLNASNHEPDVFVIGSEVHEAWERIKPILIEIVGKQPAS